MEPEIWANVSLNGVEISYRVSNCGKILNSKRNEILKPGIRGGYKRLQVWHNGKKYSVCVHRVVAQAFVPNPHNKPMVNHKDGNKLNNHATNLEWCTNAENVKHAYDAGLNRNRRDLKVDRPPEIEIPGSIWRPIIHNNDYEVSNMGQVRRVATKKFMTQLPREYIDVGIRFETPNGKIRKMYKAHRLVAESFIPNPENKPMVNHKDGNKYNNKVDNLEWCTQTENMIHAANMRRANNGNAAAININDEIDPEVIPVENIPAEDVLADELAALDINEETQ